MNSIWTENLIIFAMMLVSTRSDGRIKIRVSRPIGNQLRVKLSQTWSKLPKTFEKLGLDVKL